MISYISSAIYERLDYHLWDPPLYKDLTVPKLKELMATHQVSVSDNLCKRAVKIWNLSTPSDANENETVLTYAILAGNVELVTYLCSLTKKEDVNIRIAKRGIPIFEGPTTEYYTPISLCVSLSFPIDNRSQILEILLKNGADPNKKATTYYQVTPLETALANHLHACTSLLVEFGANFSTVNPKALASSLWEVHKIKFMSISKAAQLPTELIPLIQKLFIQICMNLSHYFGY